MVRIGLTGDLGSGKSTVARMVAERGAVVFSSDEMGRRLMQPGQDVYTAILRHFGSGVLASDGSLDRRELTNLAFQHGRAEELNAIVHPAVIAEQARLLAELEREQPNAVAVVESALIFTTQHAPAGSWHTRFDRIWLVTAPDDQKIARFVDRAAAGRPLSADDRSTLEDDARRRLMLQRSNADYASQCLVLHNDGDIEQLEAQVQAAWQELAFPAT
jgi:dephospho-CoA kinase